MGKEDPRIDAYIAKSAPFAKPILKYIRAIVHKACPEVEETLRWGFPHFDHQGVMMRMAAFQRHCALGFWKGALVLGDTKKAREALGHFGRITSIEELPSEKTLSAYVRRAALLNEKGIEKPQSERRKRAPLRMPDDLRAALRDKAKAKENFDRFSPTQQREYVEWIVEAKRPETRRLRLETAGAWIALGKVRNWKYLSSG